MSDYTKTQITAWLCGAAIIVGLGWAFAWGYVNSWRAVTDNGYVERERVGSSLTIWTKPDAPAPRPEGK